MSEEHGEFQSNLDANEVDHFVSAVQASLGGVPGIGPIVAGLVTSVIPRQRLDRVADMVRKLNDQLGDLREDFVREKMLREDFMDLLQESFPQAARSTEERRAYIAALLKNSIKSDDLVHEEEKTLLSLLGQLNDAEIIQLGWFGTNMVGEQATRYYKRHEDVVRIPLRESFMSGEEEREVTVKEAYLGKLQRLGLIVPQGRRNYNVTPLGRLLLDQIDLYALEGSE